MKFRTEVNFNNSSKKIQISDNIFSIGSCFATEIHNKLTEGQLNTFNNPFGTIFNPWSLNKSIKNISQLKKYTKEDLIFYQDEYLSLDHHTLYNSDNSCTILEKINLKIEEAHSFLKNSNWIIITYGTSVIYEFLPKKILVANCHKMPQKLFNKRLLTNEELCSSIRESICIINTFCPKNVQILFTISPVRHIKEGIINNNISKAKLFSSLHDVISNYKNCTYLPIYEIVMDDLRDYRFYKEDLIHPNNQAIQYIWEKFGNAYFSNETQNFINENLKIKQALKHRPFKPDSNKYQNFLKNIEEKIEVQQKKVKHKIFSNK